MHEALHGGQVAGSLETDAKRRPPARYFPIMRANEGKTAVAGERFNPLLLVNRTELAAGMLHRDEESIAIRKETMEREQIREVLRTLLENETGDQVPSVPDDTRIVEQFNFDSVDIVSLVMQVERHFRIRIKHEELAAVTTVGSLIDVVQNKCAEAASAPVPAATTVKA
jgi:acyl carrier protein